MYVCNDMLIPGMLYILSRHMLAPDVAFASREDSILSRVLMRDLKIYRMWAASLLHRADAKEYNAYIR